MSAKERVTALATTLAEQRATVADLESQLHAARSALASTQQEIRALHFEAWLEDDRVVFPTPINGTETVEIYSGGHRERVVHWVESRTEKGSIRLATEIRHVKPIAKGGAEMLCNLRPICRSCNASKCDKWPYVRASA
jgi:5-methylcytosine-specific restriction endonuclease McrA